MVCMILFLFYLDLTFPLFLILHSNFTMHLWLREKKENPGNHSKHASN